MDDTGVDGVVALLDCAVDRTDAVVGVTDEDITVDGVTALLVADTTDDVVGVTDDSACVELAMVDGVVAMLVCVVDPIAGVVGVIGEDSAACVELTPVYGVTALLICDVDITNTVDGVVALLKSVEDATASVVGVTDAA